MTSWNTAAELSQRLEVLLELLDCAVNEWAELGLERCKYEREGERERGRREREGGRKGGRREGRKRGRDTEIVW